MDIEDRIRQLRKELAELEGQKNQMHIRSSDEPPAPRAMLSPEQMQTLFKHDLNPSERQYMERGPYRTPSPAAGREWKTMPYRNKDGVRGVPYDRLMGNG